MEYIQALSIIMGVFVSLLVTRSATTTVSRRDMLASIFLDVFCVILGEKSFQSMRDSGLSCKDGLNGCCMARLKSCAKLSSLPTP